MKPMMTRMIESRKPMDMDGNMDMMKLTNDQINKMTLPQAKSMLKKMVAHMATMDND